ncbi:MAG: hypothetical protein L3K11_02660 [Thermoplasmata archaeon]|nr:hypothetical protein [Thermoplasmata archaeon]
MPISSGDFDKGSDPGSVESRVEKTLSDGKGYTMEEIAVILWGEQPDAARAVLHELMLDTRLSEMVKHKRIVEKVIDHRTYYARR